MSAGRTRRDIASRESHFKCAVPKNESVKLCETCRVGTLNSKSTEMPRPVKILRRAKTISPQQKIEVAFANARLFFSEELQPCRTVEISGPKRRTAVPQGPERKRTGNQIWSHNSD